VVGAQTRFQPVYVDDVAAAAVAGLASNAGGVYELGGENVYSFRALMQVMLGVVQRRRMIINIPFWIARIMASFFGVVQAVTGACDERSGGELGRG